MGGGVRDLLLGLHPKDFDVATNAHPDQVKHLFRNCLLIGKRFRLAHIRFGRDIIEVATFRAPRDGTKSQKLPHGMLMQDNVYGTIEEDALRRDFTINALYYDIRDFTVLDYCGGLKDLKQKTLRMIGDPIKRYHEDPVRLLRAVRLAAKLDFKIEEKTDAPIALLAPLLQHVPPARLFDEILKLFHSGKALATFKLLNSYALLEQLFPELAFSLKNSQDPIIESLIVATCQATDNRIYENKHVSPAYLFACFLWHPLQAKVNSLRALGQSHVIALHQAAHQIFSTQAKIVAIPRRFTTISQEIWEFQFRMEHRNPKQINRIFEHPRFRAAYDFLLLRAQSGENIKSIADWWKKYYEADEQLRSILIAELPKIKKRRQHNRHVKAK